MKLTRGIALCALTLAIALAIGAISPLEPFARAMPAPIIIIATPALAIVPLATPAPALPSPDQLAQAAPVEQPQAAPVEQPQAAPVVELPPATPVIEYVYIEVPAAQEQAAPVVEQLAAPVVEQLAAPVVEQLAAPVVEQLAAPVVEQLAAPVDLANDYQQRRLEAIKSGAAYRPRTR